MELFLQIRTLFGVISFLIGARSWAESQVAHNNEYSAKIGNQRVESSPTIFPYLFFRFDFFFRQYKQVLSNFIVISILGNKQFFTLHLFGLFHFKFSDLLFLNFIFTFLISLCQIQRMLLKAIVEVNADSLLLHWLYQRYICFAQQGGIKSRS